MTGVFTEHLSAKLLGKCFMGNIESVALTNNLANRIVQTHRITSSELEKLLKNIPSKSLILHMRKLRPREEKEQNRH